MRQNYDILYATENSKIEIYESGIKIHFFREGLSIFLRLYWRISSD